MKNKSWIMIGTYLLMFIVCIWFGVGNTDKSALVINIGLFVIVLFIFAFAYTRFTIVQKLSSGLKFAEFSIKSDAEETSGYLWSVYKEMDSDEIFLEKNLQKAYKEYLVEMKRMEMLTAGKFKCEIDNYLNKELIDAIACKNILNLIPGAMTGLGILGTFIGLSVGLQQFNTGTAAEIADSIAPLMGGIKVAFHTSIYGMVFSLVFNVVYKLVMEEAYTAMNDFLDAYDWYVTGNAGNDNASSMQLTLQNLPYEISQAVSKTMTQMLNPSFQKITELVEQFSRKATENQIRGVANIVNHFLKEMNNSLGGSFSELQRVINETCEIQHHDNELMKNILQNLSTIELDIKDMHAMSQRTILDFSGYVSRIDDLQSNMNDNYKLFQEHAKEYVAAQNKLQEYITSLVEYEKNTSESSEKLISAVVAQLEELARVERTFEQTTNTHLETLGEKAEQYTEQLAKSAKEQMEQIYNLSNTTSVDLSQASDRIETATEKVFQVVAETIDSMEKNLQELHKIFDETTNVIREYRDVSLFEVEKTEG